MRSPFPILIVSDIADEADVHFVKKDEVIKKVAELGNCIIVGKESTVFHKSTKYYNVIIDSKKMKGELLGQTNIVYGKNKYTVGVKNMSLAVYNKILSFFKWAYEEHKAEAMLYLYYSDEHGFDALPPKQKVTAGTVGYGEQPDMEGYKCIGTAHSHGSSSAFHSGTDDKDQLEMNGIHITFGNVDTIVTHELRLYVNGDWFTLSEDEILPKDETIIVFPDEWKETVEKKAPTITTYGNSNGYAKWWRDYGKPKPSNPNNTKSEGINWNSIYTTISSFVEYAGGDSDVTTTLAEIGLRLSYKCKDKTIELNDVHKEVNFPNALKVTPDTKKKVVTDIIGAITYLQKTRHIKSQGR